MTNEELHKVTADLRVLHKLKAIVVMTLDDNGVALFSLAMPDTDQGVVLTTLPEALREAANKIEKVEKVEKHETQLS